MKGMNFSECFEKYPELILAFARLHYVTYRSTRQTWKNSPQLENCLNFSYFNFFSKLTPHMQTDHLDTLGTALRAMKQCSRLLVDYRLFLSNKPRIKSPIF